MAGCHQGSGCTEHTHDLVRLGGTAREFDLAQWRLGVHPGDGTEQAETSEGREPPPLEAGDLPGSVVEYRRPGRRGHPVSPGSGGASRCLLLRPGDWLSCDGTRLPSGAVAYVNGRKVGENAPTVRTR